jgi:Cys-tRNA(Pro)/Cys-tRNA(Cys) deacylase
VTDPDAAPTHNAAAAPEPTVAADPTVAPDTPAIRAAVALGLPHEVLVIGRPRDADDAAARAGVPVDRLLKTMVVRRGEDDHLFVLVPAPRQIAWPALRAHLGVARLSMPDAEVARAVTGYERGTITPLGALTPWPTIVDACVAGGGAVTIGAGAHGVLLRVEVGDLIAALHAEVVAVS